jgi:hypothetical protein
MLLHPAARPVAAYANLFNLDDGGGSGTPLVGVMTGGVSQKTYAVSINVARPSTAPATLDSNDAIFRGNFNNHAANDANFIMRGINISMTNRSGGVLGMLDNSLGCQGKSGGTIGTIRGLSVNPENFGTVTNEFAGIDVAMKNEAAVATLEYGIRVRNINNSLGTKVTSAILVSNAGANLGFVTGLNLLGATLTNEILFSNGTKVTVSGDAVTFTNAAGDKHIDITMLP